MGGIRALGDAQAGARERQRRKDSFRQKRAVFFSGDPFHDDLRQGKSVVAVHRALPRGMFQMRPGESLQRFLQKRVVISVAKAVGVTAARQSRRMIQQHPHRDLPVAFISHHEFGNIGGDRTVQLDFAFIDQQQDGGGAVGLADRADVEHRVPVYGHTVQAVGHAESLGVYRAPLLHDRNGNAAGAAGLDRFPGFPAGGRCDRRGLREGSGGRRSGDSPNR